MCTRRESCWCLPCDILGSGQEHKERPMYHISRQLKAKSSTKQLHIFSHSIMANVHLEQPGKPNSWTPRNSLVEGDKWQTLALSAPFFPQLCLSVLICKMRFQMLSASQHEMKIKCDSHVLACSNYSINGNSNNSIWTLNISSAIMWRKTLIYFV